MLEGSFHLHEAIGGRREAMPRFAEFGDSQVAPSATVFACDQKDDQDDLELQDSAEQTGLISCDVGSGINRSAIGSSASSQDPASQGEAVWVALEDGQNSNRHGAVRVVRVPLIGIVYIGPHWYCSILMLGFVLGVGYFFVTKVAIKLGWYHLVAGTVTTVMSAKSFLDCALSDPGILAPHPIGAMRDAASKAMPTQILPSTGTRKCKACMIVQPPGCYHCEWCRVCVAGWDHHCPWMNKCIGRRNLGAFHCFLCTSLPSLAYMVVAVIASPNTII
eukprot:TRINITY_DN12712_c0_g1_i1.p1 TRINITY_DN12712_c0_g1~~TRINITY_DN12712_c0_g1_i1.p1  ORF type:complete len:313 (-),score=46.80 TRINITY_DN12712_c0_g1_i1:153-980(-)